jgi:hypothetical protein
VAGSHLIGAGNAEFGFRGQKFGRCGQQKQIIASQASQCSYDGSSGGTLCGLYIIQWLGTELLDPIGNGRSLSSVSTASY